MTSRASDSLFFSFDPQVHPCKGGEADSLNKLDFGDYRTTRLTRPLEKGLRCTLKQGLVFNTEQG
jgi:hypothetical protein